MRTYCVAQGTPLSVLWRPKWEVNQKKRGCMYTYVWRRQGHPTPVLLPGKSHGWRSLVGCSPWGREESDTTEGLHEHSQSPWMFIVLFYLFNWISTLFFSPWFLYISCTIRFILFIWIVIEGNIFIWKHKTFLTASSNPSYLEVSSSFSLRFIFSVFFKVNFYWSIVVLQCCVLSHQGSPC